MIVPVIERGTPWHQVARQAMIVVALRLLEKPSRARPMRRSASPIVAAFVVCWSVAATAQEVGPVGPIALWPGVAPGEKGDVGPEEQQPPRPGDSTIRITNVTQPSITVYRAPREKANGAAMLICPGGAYRILAYNKEGTEVAEWLNSIGVTGVVLKYRVPWRPGLEKHAAALQDGQRALGILRQRAKEWDIDPERIGVLGFSAGGHLAALLSTDHAGRAYAPVDDADRVSRRPNFAILVYPAYLVDKQNALAPPLSVTRDTPPTFLVQTQDDGVRVECSLVYYMALTQAKVRSEMHIYPTGGHGYGLRPSKDAVSTWPRTAELWMKSLRILERTS